LKPDCAGKGLDLDKLMSMLVPTDTSYKNKLIKGKESPAVYWVDDNCRLHPIPTWEMYLEFFGGDVHVIWNWRSGRGAEKFAYTIQDEGQDANCGSADVHGEEVFSGNCDSDGQCGAKSEFKNVEQSR